jgi:aspartyl-tRNA(Asn)/glutamyl-tRNA(Gln) amidotransferase subunit C
MSLTAEKIQEIARLARLEITQNDTPRYVENLSGILDFVEQMAQVDTTDITPMAHPVDAPQRLRADKITEFNQRELLQQNAPAVESGLFLVPKVIE